MHSNNNRAILLKDSYRSDIMYYLLVEFGAALQSSWRRIPVD